jgi:hypothetical protein
MKSCRAHKAYRDSEKDTLAIRITKLRLTHESADISIDPQNISRTGI